MRFFGSKLVLNFFFIFFLIYLIYHIFNGRYNIQNYLINEFELKLFQDFHYNLKQKSIALDLDLEALYNEREDFIDELSKAYSTPQSGETVIKID